MYLKDAVLPASKYYCAKITGSGAASKGETSRGSARRVCKMESLTSISDVSKMVTICHLPPASFTFQKCGLVHCLLGGT